MLRALSRTVRTSHRPKGERSPSSDSFSGVTHTQIPYGYMNIFMIISMAALLLAGARPIAGQEWVAVGLEDAVAQAREQHPTVVAARQRASAASSQVRAEGASRWPILGAEMGVLTSTDPVAAFGGRLRQGRFTQADFDPDLLNAPDALTDVDGALVLGWTPVDFSRDAAVSAARARATAADMGALWAERMAGFQAEVRYVEAAGAEVLLESARSAVAAAEANLERAELHAAEGVATEADVLAARAALEDASARAIVAEQSVTDARGRLALAMGWPAGRVPVPETDALSLVDVGTLPAAEGGRSDLRASQAMVDAASEQVRRASRARLPTVQGFARLEAHTDETFDARGDSWSVGLRVRLPLFTGFEVGARREAARAELDAVAAEHEQRLSEARTALAEARRGAEARRRAALSAEAAASAAAEAARLTRLRYEEGLSTTAELLAAEAATARQSAAAVYARLEHRIATARLLLLDDPELDAVYPEGANR